MVLLVAVLAPCRHSLSIMAYDSKTTQLLCGDVGDAGSRPRSETSCDIAGLRDDSPSNSVSSTGGTAYVHSSHRPHRTAECSPQFLFPGHEKKRRPLPFRKGDRVRIAAATIPTETG